MDHRLREIEQWVAEAREDLGEGGQDAYLQKLYLLDAEIRAVIRENGTLPGASPVRDGSAVRRQSTLAPSALGGAAAVALLAVATVLGLSLSGRLPQLALLERGEALSASASSRSGVPLGGRVVLAGRSGLPQSAFDYYSFETIEEPAGQELLEEAAAAEMTGAAGPVAENDLLLLVEHGAPRPAALPAAQTQQPGQAQREPEGQGAVVMLASQQPAERQPPVEVQPLIEAGGEKSEATKEDEAGIEIDTAALAKMLKERLDS